MNEYEAIEAILKKHSDKDKQWAEYQLKKVMGNIFTDYDTNIDNFDYANIVEEIF